MKRLTIVEMDHIRKLVDEATSGPWKSGGDKYGDSVVYAPLYRGFHNNGAEVAESLSERDALFISEAREAVPKLLTEVETLVTEKAAARRMLDELIGEMANAAEAGYALAPETVRGDLEKIRKELIDHGE